jgi:hypothetical protein
MELFNRLYKTRFTPVDLTDISIEIQRELFKFNDSILNETFGDFEYSVMNPYQLQEFVKLQSKSGIEYTLEDISESVLMGEYVPDEELREFVIGFLEKYETLEKTIDIVLDKLSKHGMSKLSKLDMQILP